MLFLRKGYPLERPTEVRAKNNELLIKVGRPVTRRPHRRSRRAVFPYRVPQDCSPPHRWGFAIRRSEVCIGRSGISYPAHVSFASCAALSLPSPCGRRYRRKVLWSDLTPSCPSGGLLSGWSALPSRREAIGPPRFLEYLFMLATLPDPGKPSRILPT